MTSARTVSAISLTATEPAMLTDTPAGELGPIDTARAGGDGGRDDGRGRRGPDGRAPRGGDSRVSIVAATWFGVELVVMAAPSATPTASPSEFVMATAMPTAVAVMSAVSSAVTLTAAVSLIVVSTTPAVTVLPIDVASERDAGGDGDGATGAADERDGDGDDGRPGSTSRRWR